MRRLICPIYLDMKRVETYHETMIVSGLSIQKPSGAPSLRMKFSLLLILSALLLTVSSSSCSRSRSYPAAQRTGSDIVVEISTMAPEVPKFFTYRFQGKNINFFVIKMADTTLSFLDACASCYPHKQGYSCEGNEVICRYCNTRYPLGKLDKGLGNCYPIKIEGRTVNGKYLIPAATLENFADKF